MDDPMQVLTIGGYARDFAEALHDCGDAGDVDDVLVLDALALAGLTLTRATPMDAEAISAAYLSADGLGQD